jgi:hypothetical protein
MTHSSYRQEGIAVRLHLKDSVPFYKRLNYKPMITAAGKRRHEVASSAFWDHREGGGACPRAAEASVFFVGAEGLIISTPWDDHDGLRFVD